MRVLYDNLLETALDLAITNLDNDSYVSNLYHPYLELACFCLSSTVTLSGRWTDPQTIDTLAIGYHNADTARVKLYDLNDNELLNYLVPLEAYDSMYYITQLANVYRFTIEFAGAENLHIGFVSFGAYVTLPRFNVGGSYPLSLNSTKSVTTGGQTYGAFARQLRGAAVSWTMITNDERSIINNYLTLVQTIKPHMIDLFYEAHASEPPMYCTVNKTGSYEKQGGDGFYFNFDIEYLEAR